MANDRDGSRKPAVREVEAAVDRLIEKGHEQAAAVAGLDEFFGRRVREERERLGIPQQHIATTMTVIYGHRWHQTTVAKVELGERPAKLSEAQAIAYILGVPLAVLIGEPNRKGHGLSKRLALAELDRIDRYVASRRREIENDD